MRDGSIASMAFDLAGFPEVTRRFFRFCNEVITEDGFFHHKYSPDGSVGSSWLAASGFEGLAIEEDETALVLYALWKHFQKFRDIEFIEEVYPNLSGQFYCLEARCSHAGAPLFEGSIDDEVLTCPWHYSQFKIKDGSVLRGPARRPLRVYRIEIKDRQIFVETDRPEDRKF